MEHIQNIIDIINHVWPSGPEPVQKVRDFPAPLYKITFPANKGGRSVVIYTSINGMKLFNQTNSNKTT
jgi:hypothetical protein